MRDLYHDAPVHTPVADNKDDMLRFLLQRFRFAGVSDTVAKLYASDIEAIFARDDNEIQSEIGTIRVIRQIREFGAQPCGSRFVLTRNETKDSDYDFYIGESEKTRFASEFPSFKYLQFTPAYNSLGSLGVFKNSELNIEVGVKEDRYLIGLDSMWEALRKDPDLFRSRLWKRNVERNVIRRNIDALLTVYSGIDPNV